MQISDPLLVGCEGKEGTTRVNKRNGSSSFLDKTLQPENSETETTPPSESAAL